MKVSEIRNLTAEEMQRRAEELTQELFNLRFQHAIGQLESNAKLRQTRRERARLLTILRETTLNPKSANG